MQVLLLDHNLNLNLGFNLFLDLPRDVLFCFYLCASTKCSVDVFYLYAGGSHRVLAQYETGSALKSLGSPIRILSMSHVVEKPSPLSIAAIGATVRCASILRAFVSHQILYSSPHQSSQILSRMPNLVVRIDNKDHKYSADNCARIEVAFRQRATSV